jgi:hypothetical protein
MTAIACRALMQNLVRRRYHAPPCPVYARLPPLVCQFPLIIVAKGYWRRSYYMYPCVAQRQSSILPTDTTRRAYIATSFAYAFRIFAHYNIRTAVDSSYLLSLPMGNCHIAESPSNFIVLCNCQTPCHLCIHTCYYLGSLFHKSRLSPNKPCASVITTSSASTLLANSCTLPLSRLVPVHSLQIVVLCHLHTLRQRTPHK